MKILAVDPGGTTGMVVLKSRPWPVLIWRGSVRVSDEVQMDSPTPVFPVRQFLSILRRESPDVVVIEDFIPYQQGVSLYTAKLIGAFTAICALLVPPIPVVMLVPAKKGRWPIARLDAKFPQHRACENGHERDALRIGLAYLEEVGEWKTKVPSSC